MLVRVRFAEDEDEDAMGDSGEEVPLPNTLVNCVLISGDKSDMLEPVEGDEIQREAEESMGQQVPVRCRDIYQMIYRELQHIALVNNLG